MNPSIFRSPPMLLTAGALFMSAAAWAQTTPATQSQPASDAAYLADFASLQMALQKLDDDSASCGLSSLTTTGEGRDVFMLTLAADPQSAGSRPAMLIVAGLDGRHRVGVETALRMARNLLHDHADLLKETTFYIVPCANPDGYQFNAGKVQSGHIGNLRAVDADRDGAADEDGPADLDGDGAITMMRRIDPPLDDRATHLPDPAEPRLLKRADAAKSERAVYSIYVEGLDADGDGEIAEDGPGEVDLDRNFMHRYPEHARDAGTMPLSEPESLALADFVIGHKNLVAVITYGRHDNLINVPDGRGSEASGQGPRDLDGGDVEYYREIAKKYKDITGQKQATGGDTGGSFESWVYAQRGIPSFASTVWGRPEVKEESKPAGDAAAKPRDAVSGDWSGNVAIEGMGEVPFSFTLTLAADNSITGTLNAAGQNGTLTGTFDPATSSAKLVADHGGGEGANIDASFKGDEMTGAHNSPDGGVVAFTAKRAAVAAISSDGAKPQAADAPAATPEPAPAAQEPAPQQGPPGGRRGGGRRGGGGAGGGRGGPPGTPGGPGSGGTPGGDTAGGSGGGGGENKPEDADAAAWLKYSDSARNKEGFIEWTAFDHPTLGKVEIGGFVPGFLINPPASELDDLASKQTLFIVDVIGRRPRLSVQGPEVKKLADGLYEIRLGIVNDGYLPTATAMARKARSIFPTVVRLSADVDHIVSGDRVNKTWGVGGSGDRVTYDWIVRADDGSTLTIDITNPHLGDQQVIFRAE